jgi:hypothetical protein
VPPSAVPSHLQSLSNCSRDHPIVNEVLYQLSHLQKAGKSVVFCWVRGHTVLPGSERAALNRNLTSDRALGSDFRTFLYHAVLSSWQDEWSNTQDNKLHTVKPSLQTWHFSFSVVRKEEVMLTWLPIGHMRVAHGYFCVASQHRFVLTVAPYLVCHILIESLHYSEACHVYFYMVHFPACLVMTTVLFLMSWLF